MFKRLWAFFVVTPSRDGASFSSQRWLTSRHASLLVTRMRQRG